MKIKPPNKAFVMKAAKGIVRNAAKGIVKKAAQGTETQAAGADGSATALVVGAKARLYASNGEMRPPPKRIPGIATKNIPVGTKLRIKMDSDDVYDLKIRERDSTGKVWANVSLGGKALGCYCIASPLIAENIDLTLQNKEGRICDQPKKIIVMRDCGTISGVDHAERISPEANTPLAQISIGNLAEGRTIRVTTQRRDYDITLILQDANEGPVITCKTVGDDSPARIKRLKVPSINVGEIVEFSDLAEAFKLYTSPVQQIVVLEAAPSLILESDTSMRRPAAISNAVTVRQEDFLKLTEKAKQPKLTRALLRDPRFIPQYLVKVGDKEFYLSRIVKGVESNGPTHDEALMYVRNQEGQFIPRALYKSKSDGGWRACLGGIKYKYSKGGKEFHYTQATKPHDALIHHLETQSATEIYRGSVVTGKLQISELEKEGLNTYPQETRQVSGPSSFGQFQKYPPGYDFHRGAKKHFQNLNFSDPELIGFVPDFNSPPIKVEQRDHTLLGEVMIETFPAKLQGRDIEWNMAYDHGGRVWIESIRFSDVAVTSYGTLSEVIDSGLLTNKPLEYSHQTLALYGEDEEHPFAEPYRDITPLLDNLKPIQDYRQARNIRRNP